LDIDNDHNRTPDGTIIDPRFDDAVCKRRVGTPNDFWGPRDGKRPHILFTTVSEAEGIDEEILKGEVLAILATMITQLEQPRNDDHNIIPVSDGVDPLFLKKFSSLKFAFD
jgi:hypothetical protein